MPISTDRLVEIAQEVARVARQRIPRSANRFLDTGAGATDWLKDPTDIQYTDFIETLVRTATTKPSVPPSEKALTIPAVQVESQQTSYFFFTETVSKDASIAGLKRAVLDFLRDGRIDGQPVNLGYKAGKAAEKEYSQKFATALAAFLNGRGFRHQREGEAAKPFEAGSVLFRLKNQLTDHDRLAKALDRTAETAFNAIHGRGGVNRNLQFPPRYIASSGRNAIKFRLGNCEECGCATFAMLVTFRRANRTRVAELAANDRIKVELVQARSEGDAHFFVLLNRPGATDIFDDFATWFANPDVVACDPWMTDAGSAGRITSTDVGGLRDYLKPTTKTGPEFLAVRAVGYLGETPVGSKDNDKFRLPSA